MNTRYQPYVTLLARLLLGGVLLVAGGLKVTKPMDSANAVAAYKLLPTNVAHLFGYALPWLEVALAVLLIVGILIRPAALIGGFIMVVFTAAIASAWARGLLIDCGCFGGGGEIDPSLAAQVHRTYFIEIMRDLGLALAAVYLYFFPYGKLSIEKAAPSTKE
ncbi:MAG: DoxX family membrane protein [Actinobacteria bacterium]|nr:DoxX family membrane protein [Actinomycetota bacterium]